jgi:hypothetical protein
MTKRRTLLLAVTLVATAAAHLAGCLEGRLPVCKTDEDCIPEKGQRVAGPICYDLRCVECRYDKDCKTGHICNSALECESLGETSGDGDKEKDAKVSWEPGSWKECAKACKDEDCLTACDQKFQVEVKDRPAEEPKKAE